jgi:hypothetical protein
MKKENMRNVHSLTSFTFEIQFVENDGECSTYFSNSSLSSSNSCSVSWSFMSRTPFYWSFNGNGKRFENDNE